MSLLRHPRALGLLTALAMLALDQGNKLWLLNVAGVNETTRIALTPFLDIVLAKNPGISYSLFQTSTEGGRLLLLAVTLAATLALGVWLWTAQARLTAVALGLLVGGALGNAYDRLAYGWVADFYHFHLGAFSWYVFNLADCGIVAGVAILLYESLLGSGSSKKPV